MLKKDRCTKPFRHGGFYATMVPTLRQGRNKVEKKCNIKNSSVHNKHSGKDELSRTISFFERGSKIKLIKFFFKKALRFKKNKQSTEAVQRKPAFDPNEFSEYCNIFSLSHAAYVWGII